MTDVLNVAQKKLQPTLTRTQNPDDADKIFQIGQSLLFTPQMFNSSNEEKRAYYADSGFVIGNHEISILRNWIEDERNSIILGLINDETSRNAKIFGFGMVIGTEQMIDQVQNYAKDVDFILGKAEKTIESRHFKYLIQIGVEREFHNNGLGSALFQKIYQEEGVPLISFVIKSPIHNFPSLYTHLKNGFQYMGDYTGEYGGFENYRSVGLIHYPNAPKPSLENLKMLFAKALQ